MCMKLLYLIRQNVPVSITWRFVNQSYLLEVDTHCYLNGENTTKYNCDDENTKTVANSASPSVCLFTGDCDTYS